MESKNKGPSTVLFMNLVVMITSSVLYIWAVPVSNNFEMSRFFLYETLIPTLVVSLTTGIICRIFKRYMMFVSFGLILFAGIMNLILLTALSSYVSTNSSTFQVVYGVMIIHQNLLYSITHAVQMSSTIASFAWVAYMHEKDHANIHSFVFNASMILCFAAATSAFLIMLTEQVGPSYIILSYIPLLGIGAISLVFSSTRGGNAREKVNQVGMEAQIEKNNDLPDALPSKTLVTFLPSVKTLLSIITLVVIAFTALLVPVQRVILDFSEDFGNRTAYIVIDRNLVLESLTITLLWVSACSIVLAFASRILKEIRLNIQMKTYAILCTCGMAGTTVIGYLIMRFDTNSWVFSFPSWVMFAVIVVLAYMIFILNHRRIERFMSGGIILGFAWAMGTLLIILGLEGDTYIDMELIPIIIITLVSILGAFIVLIMIKEGKKPAVAKTNKMGIKSLKLETLISHARLRLIQGTKRIDVHAKKISMALIIAAVAISASMTIVGTATIYNTHQRQIVSMLDGDGIIWVAHPNDRVDPRFMPSISLGNFNPTINISCAGNEIEPVELVLRGTASSTMTVYRIQLSDLNHLENDTTPVIPGWITDGSSTNSPVYWMETVQYLEDKWYDPIVPFIQKPIRKDINSVLWVLFNITAGQPAGTYNGTLTLEIGTVEGTKDISITIRLRVFGFDLPRYPTLSSYFGYMATADRMQYLTDHKLMRDCWISPKINAWHANGTVDLDFTPFNASIANFFNRSFTRFVIGYPGGEDTRGERFSANWNATEVDYWRQVQDVAGNYTLPGLNATVLDRLYSYGYDEVGNAVGETTSIHTLEQAYAHYKFLKDNGIKVRVMQTIHKPETYVVREPGDVSVSQILEVVDIWCIHPKILSNQPRERPEFVRALKQYMTDYTERNVTIWIYTTGGPRYPVPTVTLLGSGTINRALFWDCFINDYKGYFIWSASYWVHDDQGFAYGGYGGGAIIYPHETGFVGSHRGEMCREGMEDYEYFHLLKLSANDSAGQELLDKVTQLYPGYGQLAVDNKAFSILRDEIGEYLGTH